MSTTTRTTRHHRQTCRYCGRRIWWVKVGERFNGTAVFTWCARIGTKPAPITCPKCPQHYHQP